MVDRVGGGGRGSNRPAPRGRGGRPGPGANRTRGTGGGTGGPAGSPEPRKTGGLNLRHLAGNDFELTHPKCVQEMWPDYEEGLEIWHAGEPEEARDALRYALQGCGDNIWVHVALGKIALESAKDPNLARGHFGYAYELANKALPRDFKGRLPRNRDANLPFFEAIEGLIACHAALGQPAAADELRSLIKRIGG